MSLHEQHIIADLHRFDAVLDDILRPEERSLLAEKVGVAATGITISIASLSAPAGAETHTIERGETLTNIAEDHGTNVESLQAVNGISDADKIFAGDTLQIPDSSYDEVEVKPGDSFWTIARQHLGSGASMEEVLSFTNELKAVNGNDSGRIFPGDKVRVPVAEQRAPEYAAKLPVHITPESNETVSKLASRYGVGVEEFAIAFSIGDPNMIIAGQKYENVFADKIAPENRVPSPEVTETLPASFDPIHGTTVSSEAKKHGVSADEFAVTYGIEDKNRIQAGKHYDNLFKEAEQRQPRALEIVDEAPVLETQQPNTTDVDLGPVSDKVLRDWQIPTGEGTPYPDQEAADAFISKVEQISKELGFSPDYLMAVMKFESAHTFDPAIKNPHGSATGLIQFLDKTAAQLGTSTSELARMSPEEQLDYVYTYFESSKGQLKTLFDVYLRVFYPAAIGESPEYALPLSRGGYRANAGFDADKDGRITVLEISSKLLDIYKEAPLIEQPRTEENANAVSIVSEAVVEALQTGESSVHHKYVDIASLQTNSDGVETVQLKDNEGNSFGDDIALEIANDASAMLEAAESEGIRFYILSGARTEAEQVELRSEHGCAGDLVYDRSCKGSPPTAVPGRSNHNDGKALDLRVGTSGGSKLLPGSKEFKWLADNAERFGFYNLPSEPWHWSRNGR